MFRSCPANKFKQVLISVFAFNMCKAMSLYVAYLKVTLDLRHLMGQNLNND